MPNDVEFKTVHELLEAATRLPPLKIAVVDATAKHVIEGAGQTLRSIDVELDLT